MDRFNPQSAAEYKAQEWTACNSCGEVRYYTELNDVGDCPSCRKQIQEVKEDLDEGEGRENRSALRPSSPSDAPAESPSSTLPNFDTLRAIVDAAAEAAQSKREPCPNCGNPIYVMKGKRSGKWFWSHENSGDCHSRAIFFDTKDQAEQAEEIWR